MITLLLPRVKLLTAAAEILVHMDGEPSDMIVVCILGVLRKRKTRLRFEAIDGEVASLLGWGARLDDEDFDILRALVDATEPLQSRGVARAMSLEEDCSTLRLRLGPKGQLRAGGYINHLPNEGYVITEKGRNALESAPVE